MAAPPASVDGSALSVRSREIVLHVALWQGGGYSFGEDEVEQVEAVGAG